MRPECVRALPENTVLPKCAALATVAGSSWRKPFRNSPSVPARRDQLSAERAANFLEAACPRESARYRPAAVARPRLARVQKSSQRSRFFPRQIFSLASTDAFTGAKVKAEASD